VDTCFRFSVHVRWPIANVTDVPLNEPTELFRERSQEGIPPARCLTLSDAF
jgi:hypothetical protein